MFQPLSHSIRIVCILCSIPWAVAQTPEEPEEQWNVRVEVLMVSMPEQAALEMLPELQNPDKIDAAVAKIFAAIKRKEVTLTGYPMVQGKAGEEWWSEGVVKRQFPTAFEAPTYNPEPQAKDGTSAAGKDVTLGPIPTSFESQNVGATLKAEATVLAGGKWLHLEISSERSTFLRYESFESGRTQKGHVVSVQQPQFSVSAVTTTIKVQNGKRILIGVHKLDSPKDHMEFFILQATTHKAE